MRRRLAHGAEEKGAERKKARRAGWRVIWEGRACICLASVVLHRESCPRYE